MPKKKKPSEPNECIDVNSPAARKIKEKFRSDISGDIVKHLKPYFSKTCTVGQIQTSDDFRHLARKVIYIKFAIIIGVEMRKFGKKNAIIHFLFSAHFFRYVERAEAL